jgi:predicted nucleotide-binding protein
VAGKAPTSEQALVLQEAAEVYRDTGNWPTHYHLSTILSDETELDDVLASMPYGWFFPDNRLSSAYLHIQDHQPVGITIQALVNCHGFERILEAFVSGVRWAVRKRREFKMPSPNVYVDPDWPFNEFLLGIEATKLSLSLNESLFVLELMKNEPNLPDWSGSIDDPYERRIRIPTKISNYRNVESIDDYVKIREAEWDEFFAYRESVGLPTAKDWMHHRSVGPSDTEATSPMTLFVVHGHDDTRKHEVARFLERITKLDVVILHEQPNVGQTIIEKFEAHARSAAFATVLLTPDDVGGVAGSETLLPRARQNVVFELGFFAGALGRDHVAILYEEGVERPSDLDGLLYIELDPNGAWKMKLVRELQAVGIDVDAGQIF